MKTKAKKTNFTYNIDVMVVKGRFKKKKNRKYYKHT